MALKKKNCISSYIIVISQKLKNVVKDNPSGNHYLNKYLDTQSLSNSFIQFNR